MTPRPGNMLRVMTWNIHGGIGPDRQFSLARITETIDRHNPDVVALQEVDSRRGAAGARSPFELLREAVGDHGIEAKSISTADGDYGQMLVSRCPFNATEIHDITHANREPRRAIETEVHCGSGKLRVVATHFGLSLAERRTQARRLVAIARRHDMATVMLGDFNDWFWPGSLRAALKHELPGRTRHATFPSWCPVLRLDRIFCWPPNIMKHSFVDRGARRASDHLPVIADIVVE
ncbi:MAG TPA: endonuclease/exonuclease/phosphatase family protein [Xanthobacteraceae bacterium]|nr:endonuclease/exonuclease/phosphatase family protein [Xanthobacteraceae bacterium]